MIDCFSFLFLNLRSYLPIFCLWKFCCCNWKILLAWLSIPWSVLFPKFSVRKTNNSFLTWLIESTASLMSLSSTVSSTSTRILTITSSNCHQWYHQVHHWSLCYHPFHTALTNLTKIQNLSACFQDCYISFSCRSRFITVSFTFITSSPILLIFIIIPFSNFVNTSSFIFDYCLLLMLNLSGIRVLTHYRTIY